MFVDIHTHVLPGIDDGATDMETAIKMLKLAIEEDKECCLISTPHYISGIVENDAETVKASLDVLKRSAEARGLKIDLRIGSEILLSPEIPELIKQNKISTLAGSSYVLLELPPAGIPCYTADVLFKLKLDGYNPIIAHPERCMEVIKNPNCLMEYINRGIYFQVNASSLKGLYGKRPRETAMLLLKYNMAHFVASDAHSLGNRSPGLLETYEKIADEFGADTSQRLLCRNGLAVLENRELEAEEAIRVRKSIFYRFVK